MSKFLMLAAVMGLCLVGCNKDRGAEAKAYQAGCSEGINTLLQSLGAQPAQDKIDEHCKQTAQEYIKNNK